MGIAIKAGRRLVVLAACAMLVFSAVPSTLASGFLKQVESASTAPASAPSATLANPLPTPTAVPVALSLIVNQIEDVKFPSLSAYVTVTGDGGAPIPSLDKGDFEVLEDGQPVGQFEVGSIVSEQEPLAAAMVLDVSGSMDGKPLDYARQAAASFLDIMGPRDRVALVSFSSYVKVNVPFTTTKPLIAQGIANLRAAGNTVLYDAISTTVQSLAQTGSGRKVAVLLTDGEDTNSRSTAVEVFALMATKRVPVFTVGLGNGIDKGVLDKVAQQSGGSTVYAPSPLDLARAYRTLADQLRSQYVFRISSKLRADGKEHKLAVRLRTQSGAAAGQGAFGARFNPPWVDIVAPKAGQTITSTQRIEAGAKPGAGGAKVAKVDFAVDGQTLASAAAEPYVTDLDPKTFDAGRHVLKVSVLDQAGNTTSQEIGIVTALPEVPATPTPVVEPSEEVTPEPVVQQEPSDATPLQIVLVVLVLMLSLTLATVKRRKSGTVMTCRRCGTVFEGPICPTCAMEDRRSLLKRLYEVTGYNPLEEAVGQRSPK